MTSPLAAGARDADHLLRLLRQPAQAGYQQVAQRLRQPGAQLPVTKEGLDEQRVALGAAVARELPQALTHLALISAAFNLDRALGA